MSLLRPSPDDFVLSEHIQSLDEQSSIFS